MSPGSDSQTPPGRATVAKSDGIVVSMDAARLCILPHGDMVSGLKSMLLLLGVMLSGVAAWFAVMLSMEFREGTADGAFVFIMLAAILAFSVIAVASFLKVFTASLMFPTWFDRVSGKVVQLRDGQRIEAHWRELVPRVEAAVTGDAAQVYHLYLDVPANGGQRIVASVANGSPSDAWAYHEFLRRYMAAEWASLPETVCLEGPRRPLLRELSANLWTQPTHYRPWPERSALGKWLSSLALLVIALLWWPVLLLTLLASRIGPVPRFPAMGSGAGPHASGAAAGMPALPVRSAPAMTAMEQGVYAAIAVLSTAAWCWPGMGVLARVVELLRGAA